MTFRPPGSIWPHFVAFYEALLAILLKSTREQRGEKEPNTVASSASRDPTGPKPLIGGCTWGAMTVRSGPLAAIKKSRPDLATTYSKSRQSFTSNARLARRSSCTTRDGQNFVAREDGCITLLPDIKVHPEILWSLQGAWVSTLGPEASFSVSQSACSATAFGFNHEHGVTETQRYALPRGGVYENNLDLARHVFDRRLDSRRCIAITVLTLWAYCIFWAI